MKKSLLALLVLILGACSVSNEKTSDKETPGGTTGNEVADAAINDALDQLGSTDGMQLWRSFTEITTEESAKEIQTIDLYKGSDTMKIVRSVIYDGTVDGVAWDNELHYSTTSEGTFTKKNSDGLVFSSEGTSITDLKGYNQIYTHTPTIGKVKSSIKNGDDGTGGNWETIPTNELVIEYYLVKETETKLYKIQTGKNPDNNYIVYKEISDINADIFEKK